MDFKERRVITRTMLLFCISNSLVALLFILTNEFIYKFINFSSDQNISLIILSSTSFMLGIITILLDNRK